MKLNRTFIEVLHLFSGTDHTEGQISLSEQTEHCEEIPGPLPGQSGEDDG